MDSFKAFLASYHLSPAYVLGATVGGAMAMWLSNSYNQPIIFTGFVAAAIAFPLVLDLLDGTKQITKEMFKWMSDNVMTATVVIGFTLTIIAAVVAMVSGVDPETIGKLILYGGGGTVALVILEFIKPVVDVLVSLATYFICFLASVAGFFGINTGNLTICNGGGGGGGGGAIGDVAKTVGNVITAPVTAVSNAIASATGADSGKVKTYADTGASLATWGTYDFAEKAASGHLETRDYVELGANVATFGTYNVVHKGFGAIGLGW